jgi:predicted amidohydrolase
VYKNLKATLVQYPVEGDLNRSRFLEKVNSFVNQAVEQGSELIVFPEFFIGDLLAAAPAGADPILHEKNEMIRIAGEETPTFLEWVAGLAVSKKISILAGSVPRALNGEIVNTAMLAFPDGKTVLQDKLFLTACEKQDWALKPGNQLQVIDAPWGKTVILICYDVEIPVLSHLLADVTPDVILVPSCTGGIEGFHRVRWASQGRAIEHYCYVLHTGTVGPGTRTPNMNTQYGQASFITPSDVGFPRVIAEGPLNESAIVTAELDFEKLLSSRASTTVHPARDQKLNPYIQVKRPS